ncbi:hypothetical protein [Pararobbsia alpina]|uniref:Uncharacterized protein n=1 Tax=Pararobbsia alpina TaxID=621374 RepID=A0A6S7BP82_9BURK|nr:hypothetical protein [Pararobbsia alpina]CAB3808264.1 hypothetical protein LMG28138_06027 [Pararobbsia alpina]
MTDVVIREHEPRQKVPQREPLTVVQRRVAGVVILGSAIAIALVVFPGLF